MKYVSYLRVSTQRQGQSGLGLEAQRAAVATFVGIGGELLNEYIEIESGKKDDRAQLEAAISEAKRSGARLIIAKLDRLSRNAGFIFALRDSGVDFVCCDIPDANTLTIGIFAVMAQHEREVISKRTKAALAAKKARGEQLGNIANFSEETRSLGPIKQRELSRTAKQNVQATELVRFYLRDGLNLRQIAEALNEKEYKTRRGNTWSPMTVMRLRDRANAGE